MMRRPTPRSRLFLPMVVAIAAFVVVGCSDSDSSPPASTPTGAPDATLGADDHRVEPIAAIDLDETNTGIRGAIAAGLYPGDPDDPYADLQPLAGYIVIDEEWIEETNGGRRVVEGIDVQGALVIAAPDVTVRYCRVRGDDSVFYTVQNNADGDGSGFEMAWCEVDFESARGKAVLGRNMEVYRSHVRGGEDGIHVNDGGASPGPVTIEQNFIHEQFRPEEHHSDGIQFNGDPGGPVRIVGNKVINHLEDANAPLQLSGLNDIVVADNYLWGGVYFMVGGIDGTLVTRNNQLGFGSTLFGVIGVEGDVRAEGADTWAPWVDAEAIDGAGEPIDEPTMPVEGESMIGRPAIDSDS